MKEGSVISAPWPRLADSPRDSCVRLLRGVTAALGMASAALLDPRPGQGEPGLRQELCAVRAELDLYIGKVLGPLDDGSPVEPETIISGVHLGTEIDAMTELATSLADLARSRNNPAPSRTREVLRRMAAVCRDALVGAGNAVEIADPALAADPNRLRTEFGGLRRTLYQGLAAGDPDIDARTVVDLTLACRYYESWIDHACSVSVFLVDVGRNFGSRPGRPVSSRREPV